MIEYASTVREINIEPLLIVSPEDKSGNKKILKKYGFKYIEVENQSKDGTRGLGYKKNVGLRTALKKRFSYLMELNSDDIIENELLDKFLPYMRKKVPFIGIQNFGVIDGINKKAKHKDKSSCLFGIARLYSRDALLKASKQIEVEGVVKYVDKSKFIKPGVHYVYNEAKAKEMIESGMVEQVGEPFIKLWNDELMRGLDNNSEERLAAVNIFPVVLRTARPLAYDIKTDENIWKYEDMSGQEIGFLQMIDKLPQKEQKLIKALNNGVHRG